MNFRSTSRLVVLRYMKEKEDITKKYGECVVSIYFKYNFFECGREKIITLTVKGI